VNGNNGSSVCSPWSSVNDSGGKIDLAVGVSNDIGVEAVLDGRISIVG
jgi:hypothetical protein